MFGRPVIRKPDASVPAKNSTCDHTVEDDDDRLRNKISKILGSDSASCLKCGYVFPKETTTEKETP